MTCAKVERKTNVISAKVERNLDVICANPKFVPVPLSPALVSWTGLRRQRLVISALAQPPARGSREGGRMVAVVKYFWRLFLHQNKHVKNPIIIHILS